MEIDGRIIRQMILFTLIVLIVPMTLFPILLGTEIMKSSLMKTSFAFALFEFVFYGFCVYFFNGETNLPRLLLNAAICFAGRYIIGSVLGLLIAAMYAMNITIALKFGTISFWPAVALHMISTPFILKPIFQIQRENNDSRQKESYRQTERRPHSEQKPIGVSSQEIHKPVQHQVKTDYSEFQSHKPATPKSQTQTDDGFQSAVNYIGENGSTLMAAIVDNEGLLLSSFQRAMFEAEDIAPLVLPILDQNRSTLSKMNLVTPEKTDLMFEDKRLIIASEKHYTLVVISERTMDDVLNIRINQALEMIRIYTAERYSEELIGNAERIYV